MRESDFLETAAIYALKVGGIDNLWKALYWADSPHYPVAQKLVRICGSVAKAHEAIDLLETELAEVDKVSIYREGYNETPKEVTNAI